MQLNEKQQLSYDMICNGQNVFLSGPGGVGKSTVINKIRAESPSDTIFLAPTGIAALNIEGSTIHRTFGFPIGFMDDSRRRRVSKKADELFGNDVVKTIVLDEISMTRGDLFAAIDQNLRIIKGNKKAFGGLQIVPSGDFFQLAPVLNDRSSEGQLYNQEFSSPYAFDTKAWEKAGLVTIDLDQIMRQNDPTFIFALNSIRSGTEHKFRALQYINKLGVTNAQKNVDDDMLMLCTTNADADKVNQLKYAELDGQEFIFNSSVKGDFREEPAPSILRLKVGAKVLICANNAELGYVNGDRGVVTHLTATKIRVETTTGKSFEVERNEWKAFDYQVQGNAVIPVEIGSYIQLPIKLGWAVTIHKSQGMTLDRAAIYTGRGCFAAGQLYVALSRLRSIEGLNILQSLQPNEIIVDPRVVNFYAKNQLGNLF